MNKIKSKLRKKYLERRSLLTEKEKQEKETKIFGHFFKSFFNNFHCIHIYLPIEQKKEINTWALIHQMWKENKKVVVPKVTENTETMTSVLLTQTTPLKNSGWQVPEPEHSESIDEKKIDLVILPLLIFDEQGYRIGYGKGFYDKFLASLDHDVAKLGLCHFPPIEKIDGLDKWDKKMDYCITPERVFKF